MNKKNQLIECFRKALIHPETEFKFKCYSDNIFVYSFQESNEKLIELNIIFNKEFANTLFDTMLISELVDMFDTIGFIDVNIYEKGNRNEIYQNNQITNINPILN